MKEKFNFAKIEKKWHDRWEKERAFEVKEDKKKKKYYVLEMYPYPSASGLHIGHAFNYTIGDIYARFKRMNGFNVLYPMGYDSFGLPAENAAIRNKSHPKKFTEEAITNYIRQQKNLGLSYDWTREVECHKPEFYRWDQWIFLQMFKKGLAYKKKAPVNWCRRCNTVLANEQVKDGKCYLHEDTEVEIKHLEQWFLRITNYANELYEDIEKLKEWPEDIKAMQRNWIGKSQGYNIDFEIPLGKETNFVLLHGYTGSPKTNFFPWLKKELEGRGYKVSAPELPNTNYPSINEQVDYVLKNCKFDENTILLGHSLGSVISLKVLEKLNKQIKKLVLAAGFAKNLKGDLKIKPFDWEFDFEKIKKCTKEIVILRDSNDTSVKAHHADYLYEKLGSRLIDFTAEEEHICAEKEPVVLDNCLNKWTIFTTRPDTLFSVTFMVLAAQHPRLMELVTEKQKKEVEKFLKKIKSTSEKDLEDLEKEGVFTGSYAINPANGNKVPIYAGNFVLADYGSGMVMADAHDQRDYDFAKKYNIPLIQVLKPKDKSELTEGKAFEDFGILYNSGEFDGLSSETAIEKIGNKFGNKTVNYKLRDWLVSRQRFWGTPIPIIYCEKCGAVPVPEKDLPVKLPEDIKFTSERNPLIGDEKFVNTECPKCGGKARRETDTMDTFVNSSWYFLRYCDAKNNKEIFDKEKVKYWMPIDIYIGGREHATMHLIYFRFYTKFLRDIGLLNFDEPAVRLFNQGMVHGENGEKMSKSKGNVVLPEEVSEKFGIDAARLFLMSLGGLDKNRDWSDKGAEGSLKFIEKILDCIDNLKLGKSDEKTEHKINKAIKEITVDIETMKYNMAIIKLRNLFESFDKEISRKDFESFIKLLSPFCPHIAEELWEKMGNKNFVSLEKWPSFDEKKIQEKFDKAELANEQIVSDILNILKLMKEKQNKEGERVYLYVLPNEVTFYDSANIAGRVEKDVQIFAVNDKKKHDPTGKSAKAKPGKPAIFVE